MRNRILAAALSLGMLFSTVPSSSALVRHRHHRYTTVRSRDLRYQRNLAAERRARHRRHVRTAKRVGIGAAGGAAIGGLAGGGKGAAIGAGAGAGAGALYDRHKRHQGR